MRWNLITRYSGSLQRSPNHSLKVELHQSSEAALIENILSVRILRPMIATVLHARFG
jgi:hypothetical protein